MGESEFVRADSCRDVQHVLSEHRDSDRQLFVHSRLRLRACATLTVVFKKSSRTTGGYQRYHTMRLLPCNSSGSRRAIISFPGTGAVGDSASFVLTTLFTPADSNCELDDNVRKTQHLMPRGADFFRDLWSSALLNAFQICQDLCCGIRTLLTAPVCRRHQSP